jgi:glutamate-ammonia-ligase adenylyltransferase
VAGPAALRRRVAASVAAALRAADPAKVLGDTAAMRARMLRELPPRTPWDVKRRQGGLTDVEFIAQALQLLHAGTPGVMALATSDAFRRLTTAGLLPEADAAMLVAADHVWRTIQGILRIALGRSFPPALPAPVVEKLLQATGTGPDEAALLARMDEVAASVSEAFNRLIGVIDPK